MIDVSLTVDCGNISWGFINYEATQNKAQADSIYGVEHFTWQSDGS